MTNTKLSYLVEYDNNYYPTILHATIAAEIEKAALSISVKRYINKNPDVNKFNICCMKKMFNITVFR